MKEPMALALDGRPLYTFDPHQRTEEDRRAAVEAAREEILGELKRIRGLMEAAIMLAPAALMESLAQINTTDGWEAEIGNLAGQLSSLQAASAAAGLTGGQELWSLEIPQPAKAIWDALGRLTYLLGLSDGEARFLAEAAAKAHTPGEAYDGLLVFADWLEDAMRPEHALAVRRLVPADGDVLVIRYGQRKTSAETRMAIREAAKRITLALERHGRRISWVAVPKDWELTSLNPAALIGSGLVTKREHDAVRSENEELKDEILHLKADLRVAQGRLC